jgi:hypothetical protein
MIVDDTLVQQLVETLVAIRERLDQPRATEEQFLTIDQLCARWALSRRQFHETVRKSLPYAELTPDGRPRYPLSLITAHEHAALRRADGQPLHPPAPEKRPVRRKRAAGAQPELIAA